MKVNYQASSRTNGRMAKEAGVEAGFGVQAVAGEEDVVRVGEGGGGVGPVAVVEGRLSVRVARDALEDRPARIDQGRDVHVRVLAVIERFFKAVGALAVGVVPSEDRGVDVSKVPDVLFQRVGVATPRHFIYF